jgi:hypothetical protein
VIILGIVQITASLSLFGSGTYGRVVGLIAAFIGAIGALTNTRGTHPWWSLGVFAICVICIYKLTALEPGCDRPAELGEA